MFYTWYIILHLSVLNYLSNISTHKLPIDLFPKNVCFFAYNVRGSF